jgi:hypothetical protein
LTEVNPHAVVYNKMIDVLEIMKDGNINEFPLTFHELQCLMDLAEYSDLWYLL